MSVSSRKLSTPVSYCPTTHANTKSNTKYVHVKGFELFSIRLFCKARHNNRLRVVEAGKKTRHGGTQDDLLNTWNILLSFITGLSSLCLGSCAFLILVCFVIISNNVPACVKFDDIFYCGCNKHRLLSPQKFARVCAIAYENANIQVFLELQDILF